MQNFLLEMMRSGHLDKFQCGISYRQARSAYGPPESVSTAVMLPFVVWRYVDLEVTFLEGKMMQLAVDYNGTEPALPKLLGCATVSESMSGIRHPCVLYEGWPSWSTTQAEFKQRLIEERIPFQPDSTFTFQDLSNPEGDQTAYKVGPGVSVIFDYKDRIATIQYQCPGW